MGTYYKADALGKSSIGREGEQDMHNTLEGSHKLSILSSEFIESLRSLLKEGGDGDHRITRFELFGERMVSQFRSCLPFVILYGNIEERLKGRGWGGVTHIGGQGDECRI